MSPRLQRATRVVGLALLALLVMAGTASVSVRRWLNAPAELGHARQVEVEIPAGASTARIAALLEERGIVRSGLAFRILSRIEHTDGRLKAGVYLLDPGLPPQDILNKLISGEEATRTFTVPEGLRVEEIAQLLAKRGLGDQDELLRAMDDATLAGDLLPAEAAGQPHPLEGYLLPETYRVPVRATPRDLVAAMVGGLRSLWTPELAARARQQGLNLHEVLTLASIVEEEVQRPEERPVIAGVYLRRLRIGMKLDADPTIRYALNKYGKPLLYKDLEVDSPYNTYRRPGLPPGPISAPGRDSILAVLNPADVPYLYFVARPDGTHAFSRTLSEHNRNVAQYIK